MPNPHHQRQVRPRSGSGSESFSPPRRNDEPFDPHCPTSYSAYLPPEQQRELVNVMQRSLRALEDALLGNIYIARFAASILAAIEAKQSAIERASQPKGRRKRGVAGAKSRGRANQVLAEVDPPSTSMLLSTIEEKTVEAVSQRSPRAFSRHNLRTFTPLIRERLSLIDEHIHQWASAHESLHDKRTPSALRSTARKSMQFHSHCASELIRSIGNLRFIRDSLLEQLRGVASSVAEGGATSNTQPLSQEVYAALQETPESFSKRLAEVNEAHERAYSARNTLMITNQAMVSSVAARVLRSFSKIRIHLSKDDLMSEGNLGLIEGLEKVDPCRETKVSTYLYDWIRQAMTRSAERTAKHHFRGRIRVGQVKVAQEPKSYREHASPLDDDAFEQVTEHGHGPLDKLPSPLTDTGLRALEFNDLQQNLARLLQEADLNDRQKYILCSRFGLDGAEIKTLAALAEELNLTDERIRQIENNIVKKLRKKLSSPDSGKLGDELYSCCE